MKKILLTLLLALSIGYIAKAQQTTISGTVLAGTMTNIYVGPFKITSAIFTSTNVATGAMIDSNTNLSGTYSTLAYSNVLSYLTNSYNLATNLTYSQFYYTNYFGVVTYLTNWTSGGIASTNYVLVDVTNSVAAATYNLPTINFSLQANIALNMNPINATFYRGISITNNSGTLTPAITFTIVGTHL